MSCAVKSCRSLHLHETSSPNNLSFKMLLAPALHSETCLSPTPASSSEILSISANPQSSSGFAFGRKRAFDEVSGIDEESYASKQFAQEGTVFFRSKSRTPRSFLWRVVEDRKVVEVQCVDLVRSTGTEGNSRQLCFRLDLGRGIVRKCVALADPEEADALDIFVLTTGGELVTFTLKKDLLGRETAPSDVDPTRCFRVYSSPSLQFRHAYRMVAVSSLEILISLHDGGLMRLQRQPNETGAQWTETLFSAGGWSGTLRGLVSFKRHQTVRYHDLELDASAIVAIAKSPDGKFIWTVGLDHELKAWSTATGTTVTHVSLLNEPLEQERKKAKSLMSSEQGTVLQVVTLPQPTHMDESPGVKSANSKTYFLLLHIPKEQTFKIFEVIPHWSSVEGDTVRLVDAAPSTTLRPPVDDLMNTNVWHMDHFVAHAGPNWKDTELWISVRDGSICRIFTVTFTLSVEDGDMSDFEDSWRNGWSAVGRGSQTAEALKTLDDFPGAFQGPTEFAETPNEKWLDFIFYPGRFSTASIEVALYIYRKGRALTSASAGKGLNLPDPPLKERLSQAITANTLIPATSDDMPDFERYHSDIDVQWRTFNSLLIHLHHRRGEFISFTYDVEDQLAWTTHADFVCPIRTNSRLEDLQNNDHLLNDDQMFKRTFPSGYYEDQADDAFCDCVLLSAARNFRRCLRPAVRAQLTASAVRESIGHDFGNAEHNEERMFALYDQHNFNDEVSDEDFKALESSVAAIQGTGNISSDDFLRIFEVLDSDAKGHGKDTHQRLRRYGEKLVTAVAQETLERDRGVILDMLHLVLFLFNALDHDALHRDFVEQVSELWDSIMTRLKHNEILTWLAKNEMQDVLQPNACKTETTANSEPLLKAMFIAEWQPRSEGNEPMSHLLTDWSKAWTYGVNLHQEWDYVTGHVLAVLIKESCFQLALEFRKFLEQGAEGQAWLRYLEGRLFLATNQHEMASCKFKDAWGVADGHMKVELWDSASLLSEKEHDDFGRGKSRYFQHISSLFDKKKVWSYTATFAYLALEQLGSDDQDMHSSLAEIDKRKINTDSPVANKIGDTMEEIQILKLMEQGEDIRARLFNALLSSGRWEDAFEIVTEMKHCEIRRAALKMLIEGCVKAESADVFLALDFARHDLIADVDSILLKHARDSLGNDRTSQPFWHQLLYSFRTFQSDFRGAAEILYLYLQHLLSTHRRRPSLQDPSDETVVQVYVLLINSMVCCGEDNAWLLATDGGKRRLIMLDEIRKSYVTELDRRSDMAMGRFPLVGEGDDMDVDGS